LGDAIGDKVSDVWDLDAEGELNGVSFCLFLLSFSFSFSSYSWFLLSLAPLLSISVLELNVY
jgi:hypothetical protein